MDKLASCPICLKAAEIVVEGVERDPDGGSMSLSTCPECGREVVVAFELAPHVREKDAEWMAERRKSGEPMLMGEYLQQGGCPNCGEWVEIRLEESITNEDGHRLSWGTCPECGSPVIAKLTECGLTWVDGSVRI